MGWEGIPNEGIDAVAVAGPCPAGLYFRLEHGYFVVEGGRVMAPWMPLEEPLVWALFAATERYCKNGRDLLSSYFNAADWALGSDKVRCTGQWGDSMAEACAAGGGGRVASPVEPARAYDRAG